LQGQENHENPEKSGVSAQHFAPTWENVIMLSKGAAFAGARKPPKPRKKRRFFAKLCPNLGKCMAAAEKVGAESGHYELPKWRTCSPV